jgi:Uma2 family endonuclease
MSTVTSELASTFQTGPMTAPVPEFGELYEVVDGKLVEKPHMGVFETWIASELLGLVVGSINVRQYGRFVSETLFLLAPGGALKRRPDLAFVSYERWPRNRAVPKAEFWEVVPDLVVEVISPTNGASDVLIRIGDYFGAGVRAVWVVYPNEEIVYSYRSPTDVTILTRTGTLEAPAVLPGFQLALERLFEQPEAVE